MQKAFERPVSFLHLNERQSREFKRGRKIPLAIVHPSYLETYGGLPQEVADFALHDFVRDAKGRHVLLFVDPHDRKFLSQEGRWFLGELQEKARGVVLVPTYKKVADPFVPSDLAGRSEEEYLASHAKHDNYTPSRDRLGTRWIPLADFLKAHGKRDLDLVGVMGSSRLYTPGEGYAEEHKRVRDAIGAARGKRYSADASICEGCMAKVREELFKEGIRALIVRGRSFPSQEEYF